MKKQKKRLQRGSPTRTENLWSRWGRGGDAAAQKTKWSWNTRRKEERSDAASLPSPPEGRKKKKRGQRSFLNLQLSLSLFYFSRLGSIRRAAKEFVACPSWFLLWDGALSTEAALYSRALSLSLSLSLSLFSFPPQDTRRHFVKIDTNVLRRESTRPAASLPPASR